MPGVHDYYLQCSDYNTLAGFLTFFNGSSTGLSFINVIGPRKGIPARPAVAATAPYTDGDGVVHAGTEAIDAVDAIGDEDTWYCCIRVSAMINLALPEGVTECDHELGVKILGVYA